MILFVFLLPLFFMLTSALKTEDQIANGNILPTSPATAAVEGEDVARLNVPIDGEVRALALVSRAARRACSSTRPTGTEIVWEGNWRGLELSYSVDLTWSTSVTRGGRRTQGGAACCSTRA